MISSFETLRLSFQSLKANKLRTALTALGLVIGNFSVILVVTISLTSRDYLLEQIQRLGSNLIYASYDGASSAEAHAVSDFIKLADVQAVRQQLQDRGAFVTGIMISTDRMRVEGREEDIGIIGADEYYPQVRNLSVLAGRFLDAGDVANRYHVAMLTEKLARRLFGSQEAAIGQSVKLQGLKFSVIGTFKERSQSFGLAELKDENIVIPSSVLQYFAPVERIDPLYVKTRTPEDVAVLTPEIKSLLMSRHRPGARYTVDNLGPILETGKLVAEVLSLVLVLVSGIALVISGIGIMNIMMVTVTERTREIGLRLAVGASRRDVLAQFLAEAVLLSVGGGLFGIFLGVAVPMSVQLFAPDFAIPISGVSIAVAFGVSVLVGLVFGILPASRASKLNPTEALRYE